MEGLDSLPGGDAFFLLSREEDRKTLLSHPGRKGEQD